MADKSSPFTKADVDYLVDAAKFIKSVPVVDRKKGAAVPDKIQIQGRVFKASEPRRPIAGLIVKATLRTSPPGIPKANPSSALEWFGLRIRGLNYEVWHDNPDGTTVLGWHEHLWTPQYKDSYVIPARPTPTRRGMLDIFKWGLAKWNIEVKEEQLEVPSWNE